MTKNQLQTPAIFLITLLLIILIPHPFKIIIAPFFGVSTVYAIDWLADFLFPINHRDKNL